MLCPRAAKSRRWSSSLFQSIQAVSCRSTVVAFPFEFEGFALNALGQIGTIGDKSADFARERTQAGFQFGLSHNDLRVYPRLLGWFPKFFDLALTDRWSQALQQYGFSALSLTF
jgi:hypothetical protein